MIVCVLLFCEVNSTHSAAEHAAFDPLPPTPQTPGQTTHSWISNFVQFLFPIWCFDSFSPSQRDLAVDDMVNLVPAHSPEFEEVLRGCLQPIPEERLTPSELLELEWFRPFRRPITLRQSHSSTEEEVEGGVGKAGAISPASSGKESGSMTSHSAATETTEVMSIDGDNHGEGHGNKYTEKGEGGKSEDKGDNVQGGKDKGVPRQREDGGSGCFDDDDDGDGDECGGEQHVSCVGGSTGVRSVVVGLVCVGATDVRVVGESWWSHERVLTFLMQFLS